MVKLNKSVVLQSKLKRQIPADSCKSGRQISNAVKKRMLNARIAIRNRLSSPRTTVKRDRNARPYFNAEEPAWAPLAIKR